METETERETEIEIHVVDKYNIPLNTVETIKL